MDKAQKFSLTHSGNTFELKGLFADGKPSGEIEVVANGD